MIKRFIKDLLGKFDYSIERKNSRRSQIGGPADSNYLSLSSLSLTDEEEESLENFRTDRYFWINEYRWRLLLQTGIIFKDKIVFEPGAGIGDQTAWLLQQGVKSVIVSEGRGVNVGIIQKRFANDSRVKVLLGDLEQCLNEPTFQVNADIVYLWGVYYHINDPIPSFPILHKLSEIAPTIVLDFQESLTGEDYLEKYYYENTSASMSHASWRLTLSSMAEGVRSSFGNAYFPVEQMNWIDPSTESAPRRIIIGANHPLSNSGLIQAP